MFKKVHQWWVRTACPIDVKQWEQIWGSIQPCFPLSLCELWFFCWDLCICMNSPHPRRLCGLASYRGRTSPISPARDSWGLWNLLLGGMLLFRQGMCDFPIGEFWQFFSLPHNPFLPLVSIYGTASSLGPQQQAAPPLSFVLACLGFQSMPAPSALQNSWDR